MKKKYMYSLITFGVMLVMLLPSAAFGITPAPVYTSQTPLDGSLIPQFAQELPVLDAAGGTIQTIVDDGSQIEVEMREFKANMLPSGFIGGYSGTWVWGYVKADTVPGVRDTYTGPVVVAQRGSPT